jgi:hypothetical protein
MNTKRSDRDFGEGGDPVEEAPENAYTTNTWEPRDNVKGDVARMMFYMDVRYDTGTDTTMPDLVLVDHVGTPRTSLTDGIGELGKLCTLLAWNTLDPVDSFEIERNNTIYEYQGNRNPFIDHPEWVDTIYADACKTETENQAPTVSAAADQTVASNASVTIAATAADNDGTIVAIQWSQTSGTIVTLANEDTTSATFTAPEVSSDTRLVFTVVVTDDKGATAQDTVTITVKAAQIPKPEQPDSDSSGGSIFYLLASGLLLLLRRKNNELM